MNAIDTTDLDYQIGVMQAFKAGKKIESRIRDMTDWIPALPPRWNWVSCEYRVVPDPKLRPWVETEVPLGAWVRMKSDSGRAFGHFLITYVDRGGVPLSFGKQCTWIGFSELFDLREHSTDGGLTWKPCGVEEARK